MDLALNNQQRLICNKTQTTIPPTKHICVPAPNAGKHSEKISISQRKKNT